MSPNQARQDGKDLMVAFNLWNNAKRNRQYPKLEVGDEVRIMIKKQSHTKGYFPKWSTEKYKITYINGNPYLVNDNKRKVYYRNELLKV